MSPAFFAPKKQQYALRAILELARRYGRGPVKINEIAQAQAIPRRFLEGILSELKGSGYVDSKRGYVGGYELIKAPGDISVGDVFRFIQRDQDMETCAVCASRNACPFTGRCVVRSLWDRVKDAAYRIYDSTTILDLLTGRLEDPPTREAIQEPTN